VHGHGRTRRPGSSRAGRRLRRRELGAGSNLDIPTAILIWLMITPMTKENCRCR
jgi:hypothetical protein